MFGWTAGTLIFCGLVVSGCVTSESKGVEGTIHNESTVVGFIHIEPTGPYFRLHQTDPVVRFFDVRNSQTGEWHRVHLTMKSKSFEMRLSPGHYELFRIQIGEGPFRSEAHVDMSFDVRPDKANYLGIWHLRIDSPQTVRMLRWGVIEEVLDWPMLAAFYPKLDEKDVVISLPQPQSTQIRLFAVAPSQPRAKYFYRR